MCKDNHVKCKNHRHSIVLLNPLESVTEQRNPQKKKKEKEKTHCVGRKNVHADAQTNKSKEVLNPGHCGALNTGLLCFDAAEAHMVFH